MRRRLARASPACIRGYLRSVIGLLIAAAFAGRKDEVPSVEGFVEMRVAGVMPTEVGPAVLLTNGDDLVPIFVGESEGLAIAFRHEGRKPERPLTVDLLDAMLEELDAEVVQVRIDALKDGSIFVAIVGLKHKRRITWLDARSSDAIALALGAGLPIWVHPTVIEQADVARERLPPQTPL